MALGDKLLGINITGLAAAFEKAIARAQVHGLAALLGWMRLGAVALAVYQRGNNGVLGFGLERGRVCGFEAQNIAGIFNEGRLQAQTDTQERYLLLAGILSGQYLAFEATDAAAAGNQDGVELFQNMGAGYFNLFGVDFDQLQAGIISDAGMVERFLDRFIGVVELHIFTDQADADTGAGRHNAPEYVLPLAHIRRALLQLQQLANEFVQSFALKDQRELIDGVLHIFFLDDRLEGDVTEEGNLFAQLFCERVLAATDDDMRGDSDFAQLGD